MGVVMPTGQDSITAEWLSEQLGASVERFSLERLDGGVLADVYRIADIVHTAPAPGAPTSVVIKMATNADEQRTAAVSVRAYQKELNFFRHLAADTPIRSPHIYACVDDGLENPERFAILMEDLSAHSKVFDQVLDPPDARFARKLALDAARLHAHYWESDATRLPWLSAPGGNYVFALDALSRTSPECIRSFLEQWQHVFGEDLLDANRAGEARRLIELLCGPSCGLILDRIYAILSSRPRTVLHGDMRADNLFRSDSARGLSDDESELTFIDWQVMHAGPPGPEFSQAWMHSLEPEVRRNDLQLLQEYQQRLVGLNPAAAAYTYDMLVEDYALGCCMWLTALIPLCDGMFPSFADPLMARTKQLWYKGMTRAVITVTDLGCMARVEAIAAGIR